MYVRLRQHMLEGDNIGGVQHRRLKVAACSLQVLRSVSTVLESMQALGGYGCGDISVHS